MRRPRRCPKHRSHSRVSRSMCCSAGRNLRQQLRSTAFPCAVSVHSASLLSYSVRSPLLIFSPPNVEGGLAIRPPRHCREAHQPCQQEVALASVRCTPHRPSRFSCPRVSDGSGGFSLCIWQTVTGQRKWRGQLSNAGAEGGWLRGLKPSREKLLWSPPLGALATCSSTWPHHFHTEI